MVLDTFMLALGVGAPWATIGFLLKIIHIGESRISDGLLAIIAFFMALPAQAALGWIWLHTDLSAVLMLLVIGLLAMALGFILVRRSRAIGLWHRHPAASDAFTPAAFVLLALAIANLSIAGWFNFHLGFVAWDAWDSWMLGAKTWFHTGEMNPLVSFGEWANSKDESVYALHHSQTHWATLSLATVWNAAVIDSWNERILTIPWWAAFCFLVFGVYSFLRNRECTIRLASAGAFMVSTLPLLGFHAALAGYADLWVAGLLFSFVAYLLSSVTIDNRSSVIIVGVLGLSLGAVKITALFWVAIVTGSWLVVWLLGGQYGIGKRVLYALGGAAVAAGGGLIIAITGTSFGEKAGNLAIFAREVFSGWNWLLAWWLFGAAFLSSLFMRFRADRDILLVVGGVSIILLAIIFANEFIVKGHEVIATSNRLVLHLMPIIISGIILTFRDLLESPGVEKNY